MKASVIVLGLFLLWVEVLQAQTFSENNLLFNGKTYDVFVVKVDSLNLSNLRLIQNTTKLKHSNFVQHNIVAGDSDFFLINACVNNAVCKPEGLFINNGVQISPLNLNSGNTNFYLKPNGVLSVTRHGKASITESTKALINTDVIMAVQSGPMLVVNGKYNPQLTEGSANKNKRCGVGIYTSGGSTYLVFAISNQPVNFFEFADFFKKYYRCENALCLESAGCAMYLPFVDEEGSGADLLICNYIIFK